MNPFKKKSKKKENLPFGKDFAKGNISKELKLLFRKVRGQADKTFARIQQNPEEVSLSMEKTFEILMQEKMNKELEPESFMMGVVFGLSRWSFLISEANKVQREQEEKGKKLNYVA